MTEQLNMLVDFNDAVKIYEAALIKARETGLNRGEAKKLAKELMYEKYPSLKKAEAFGEDGNRNPLLWNMVSKIVGRYYGDAKSVALPDVQEKDRTFMDKMRDAAKTGFIPSGEYLAPFVGEKRAGQVSAYINYMAREGYKIERNGHGYLCTPTETPAEKAARERQEQADRLETEVKRLMEEVRKLRAS